MKIGLVIILAALMFAPVSAQETGTTVEPSPALLEHIAELEAATAELRELAPLEPVDRYFPQTEDVAAFLAGQFEDPLVLQSVLDYEIIYKAFDLLPQDINLRQVYEELLVSQVGGYYDPDTKRMNTLLISSDTLTDRLPLLEQIVYVHEFTHALQDQHFDFNTLLTDEIALNEPDRATAIQALFEGDATQTMTDFLTVLTEENPAEVMGQLDAMMSMSASMEVPAGTPDILTTELTFPYLQGQVFVQALVAEGGYDLVNEAFRNPPLSTEQIIHPEKYISGEAPIAVELVDNSAALGDGWTLAYDRTAGEYFLRNWLKPGLSAFTMPIAASGWGGDRYHLYTNAEGQAAWEWLIVFDTDKDQAQFLEYLPQGWTYQYGESNSDLMCWDVTEESFALCYHAHPDGGVIITRAPSVELAMALLPQ